MITCPIADVFTDVLSSPAFGMSADVANLLTVQMIRVAAELGYAGSEYYLPYMHNLSKSERNALIRRDFNGRNLRDVCRKYGVSKTTVYRACNQ